MLTSQIEYTKKRKEKKRKITNSCFPSKSEVRSNLASHIYNFITDLEYRYNYLKMRYNRGRDLKLVENPINNRGKCRDFIDWSPQVLLHKLVESLNKLIDVDQRKDAEINSTGAMLKRIPDCILKSMFKISAYKKNFYTTVDSYMIAYTEGFIKIFNSKNDDPTIESFVDFISLKYPKDNVSKIIVILQNSGHITLDFASKANKFISTREKHTQKHLQLHYNQNSTFKIIIQNPQIFNLHLSSRCQSKLSSFLKLFNF